MKAKKNKKKGLNAVAMKNKIQSKLYQETKGLNSKELIEFYRIQGKAGPIKKKKVA